MEQQQHPELSAILTLITGWKLNKAHLASKCGINAYTFKMKLAGKPPYKFTDSEVDKIAEVLKELSAEIEISCGISFNKALAKIARKKV